MGLIMAVETFTLNDIPYEISSFEAVKIETDMLSAMLDPNGSGTLVFRGYMGDKLGHLCIEMPAFPFEITLTFRGDDSPRFAENDDIVRYALSLFLPVIERACTMVDYKMALESGLSRIAASIMAYKDTLVDKYMLPLYLGGNDLALMSCGICDQNISMSSAIRENQTVMIILDEKKEHEILMDLNNPDHYKMQNIMNKMNYEDFLYRDEKYHDLMVELSALYGIPLGIFERDLKHYLHHDITDGRAR